MEEQQPIPTGALSEATVLGGRYRIEQRLGQGGMGAVYLAYDERLDIQCAIKEMSTALFTDPVDRERARRSFHEEAKLLARLSHPNLPRVTDHFSDSGKEYLVMEYVPGETLAQVLRRTPPPWSVRAMMQVAKPLSEVLEYLHTRTPPIIFRDLKPANVIRMPDGTIKLIDFGIARLFKPGQSHDTQAFGTVGYSAPEQYGQGQTDARSDVYALGVLLHQLLTGHDPVAHPFNLPPAQRLNPEISSEISSVLQTSVSHDPSDRFASMQALRRALTSAAEARVPSQPFVRGPQQSAHYPVMQSGVQPYPQQGHQTVQGVRYQQTIPQSGPTYGPPTPQQPYSGPPTPQQPYSGPPAYTQTSQQPSYTGLQTHTIPSYQTQHIPQQSYAGPPPVHVPQTQAVTTTVASLSYKMAIGILIAVISSFFLGMKVGPVVAALSIAISLPTGILGIIGLASQKTSQTKKGHRHALTGLLIAIATLVLACVSLTINS